MRGKSAAVEDDMRQTYTVKHIRKGLTLLGFWFKVLRGLCGNNERIEALAKETCELRNLLQSILKSTRSR